MQQQFIARKDDGLKTYLWIVYAIHAISLFTAFPALVGIIINYIKLGEARDTYYEQHFRWQIRTFWWSLVWGVVGAVTTIVGIGFVILGLAWVWMAYRVIRGAMALNDRKNLPI